MGDEPGHTYEPLTDREREILRLIADGLTNQQIADRLFLTLDTVKWYNKQSYQKLRVRSRTQAIARARELSLVEAVSEPRLSSRENTTSPLKQLRLSGAKTN